MTKGVCPFLFPKPPAKKNFWSMKVSSRDQEKLTTKSHNSLLHFPLSDVSHFTFNYCTWRAGHHCFLSANARESQNWNVCVWKSSMLSSIVKIKALAAVQQNALQTSKFRQRQCELLCKGQSFLSQHKFGCKSALWPNIYIYVYTYDEEVYRVWSLVWTPWGKCVGSR